MRNLSRELSVRGLSLRPHRPLTPTGDKGAMTMASVPAALPAAATPSTIRLALIDADSGFLQVLGKRLDDAGWQHRVLSAPVALDTVIAMRLDALVLDPALLGSQEWTFLERL